MQWVKKWGLDPIELGAETSKKPCILPERCEPNVSVFLVHLIPEFVQKQGMPPQDMQVWWGIQ